MPTLRSYDGTELHYRTVGTGPPLVVHPGGPGRDARYLGDLGGLSGRRTLVILDPRGTGASAAPEDPATYAWDRLDADLDALIDHLALDVFDLLGHSAGTRVAVGYAVGQWRRLRRLVLVTPSRSLTPEAADDTDTILAERSGEPWYPQVMAARAELDALHGDAPITDVFALLHRVEPSAYGRWDEAARRHWEAGADEYSPAAREGFLAGGGAARLAPLCRGVRVPVLTVAGSLDCASGVEGPRALARLFPRGQCVVLDGAGHYPWLDDPARFVDTVEWFLE